MPAKTRAATLAILAVAIAAAQDLPRPDPRGWSAATWGMTLHQVRAAFPAATPLAPPVRNNGALRRLEAGPLEFGPVSALALFEFAPDADRLAAVTLEVAAASAKSSSFAAVREALVDKYGRPTSSEHTTRRNSFGSAIENHTVQWVLPHTAIRLTWLDAGELGSVTVRYSERKPDDSL